MLRCSSSMQVKCNWYRMGAIGTNVKRNNFKTPLPEAASRLIESKTRKKSMILELFGKPIKSDRFSL